MKKIMMVPWAEKIWSKCSGTRYPCASPTGLRFEKLSHHASLAKLLAMMGD